MLTVKNNLPFGAAGPDNDLRPVAVNPLKKLVNLLLFALLVAGKETVVYVRAVFLENLLGKFF